MHLQESTVEDDEDADEQHRQATQLWVEGKGREHDECVDEELDEVDV